MHLSRALGRVNVRPAPLVRYYREVKRGSAEHPRRWRQQPGPPLGRDYIVNQVVRRASRQKMAAKVRVGSRAVILKNE